MWYWRQRINGKDVWRSLGTANKKDAEALAYRIWFAGQSEIMRGMVLVPPVVPLASAWDAHAATERFQLLAASSRAKREQRWRAFAIWAETQKIAGVGDVTVKAAEAYLSSLEGKAKTWNNVRSDLAAVLPVFAETPQRSITRGAAASDVVRPLDDAEIARILDYLASPACRVAHAGEWRMAVQIALGTGLRYKDVATLRWDAIHNGVLTLIPAKTARLGKSVLMRLPPRLRATLDAIPRSGDHVLPNLAVDYDETRGTQAFCDMLRRGLGIVSDSRGRAGFHSLRVVFATRARAAGISADLLGGILGHGTEAQTEHYNRSSSEVDLGAVEL
jgi:integrase